MCKLESDTIAFLLLFFTMLQLPPINVKFQEIYLQRLKGGRFN